ncbi:MAG: LTA synthase family protein [Gemmatimonadota bacterium]
MEAGALRRSRAAWIGDRSELGLSLRAAFRRLAFCARYFLAWMMYFAVLRLVFLLYHAAAAERVGVASIARTFVHGARMDMAATAYPAVVAFALAALSLFLPRLGRWLVIGFTAVMVLALTLIATVDMELFRVWGFRIDGAVLRYLNTPREMLASAGASPVLVLVVILIGQLGFAAWLFRHLLADELGHWERVRLLVAVPTFALLAGLCWFLYYPARGGFQKQPMTQSTVYFSRDPFANQAAINASWNFFDSIWWRTYETTNPYRVLPTAEAGATTAALLTSDDAGTRRLLRIARPNVIVILWESLTAKVVGRLGGVNGVTPNLDSLIPQGVLFSRFFATGDRSPEGLTAVVSGYPAQPTTEIIQHPRKSVTLPALPHDLGRIGYHSRFYYGGDPEFTNFTSYLLQAGFDSLVTASAFRAADRHSSWGADDHVVLGRLQHDLPTMPRPFFVTLFTLSSHEPFLVPMTTVIAGSDERSRFLNAHAYTDRSIGDFVRVARRMPWWDSTLIIIVADHGHRLPALDSLQSVRKWETFAIPMLWLGGALATRDTVITRIGGQADIPHTLLAQLGVDATAYRWSRNLLDVGAASWAWFTFTDGWGLVSDSGALAWDNVGRRPLARTGRVDAGAERTGQSLLQALMDDYLNR